MTSPLALTMGDPAGIGPEICIKALATDELATDVVLIGDLGCLRRTAGTLGVEIDLHPISEISQRAGREGVIDVLTLTDLGDLPVGRVHADAGAAAYRYIEHAVERIRTFELRALVTAPINKEALHAAGVPFPGHTEMLAHLAGVEHVAMMLFNSELRVVLATVHVSLLEAIAQLDVDAELRAIHMAAAVAPTLGIAQPRIAVAGLNPHAGEGGMFGSEEQTIITPAIEAARLSGLEVSGPWPGDTVFMRARRGDFDFVVAQYHDQGLIPIKYLGLDEGVNVTLGLPFVRTSVDHGTAFAIAGQGRASAASLVAAVHAARQLTASTLESA
jgi:4-hydroxythreonine-4-phosphate dehydrogenase